MFSVKVHVKTTSVEKKFLLHKSMHVGIKATQFNGSVLTVKLCRKSSAALVPMQHDSNMKRSTSNIMFLGLYNTMPDQSQTKNGKRAVHRFIE